VGQGSNDGVLEFRAADRDHLAFRLGLQFRDLEKRPSTGLLPARYVRVQVASPPPRRVDGTLWAEGLVVSSGARFDPDNPPADGKVFPISGIAPLDQPDPGTIVLDRWLAAPAVTDPDVMGADVADNDAPTQIFTLGPADPRDGWPLSFLSVAYPDPSIDGTPLSKARVNYYRDDDPPVRFEREVNIAEDGVWVAVSADRFFPPERPSADYIVRLVP
jgi:hypothetical protein